MAYSQRRAINLLRKVYRDKGSMEWEPMGFAKREPIENARTYYADNESYVLQVKCSECGHWRFSLIDTCPECGRIWKYNLMNNKRFRHGV